MLANKWVQAVLLLGLGLGVLIGMLGSIFSPVVVLFVAIAAVIAAAWLAGDARGTDGWGGPYHGPRTKP